MDFSNNTASSSTTSKSSERSEPSTDSISKSTPFTLRKPVSSAAASTSSCSKRNKKPRYPNDILPGGIGPVIDPNKNDVLSGRGGKINSHSGNVQFREMVKYHQAEYLSKDTKKLDKAKIAHKIVQEIRNMDPPGCFLRHDTKTNCWIEIGDARARKKTGQAMREGAPNIREELVSTTTSSMDGARHLDSDGNDTDEDSDTISSDLKQHNTHPQLTMQQNKNDNTYMPQNLSTMQNNAFKQHQLQQQQYPIKTDNNQNFISPYLNGMNKQGFHPNYQTSGERRSPLPCFTPGEKQEFTHQHQHQQMIQNQFLMMKAAQAQAQAQAQQHQGQTQNFMNINQPAMSNEVRGTSYPHHFHLNQHVPPTQSSMALNQNSANNNFQQEQWISQEQSQPSVGNFYNMNMSASPAGAVSSASGNGMRNSHMQFYNEQSTVQDKRTVQPSSILRKAAAFDRSFTLVRPSLNSSDTAASNFSSMSLGSIISVPSLTSSGTTQPLKSSLSPADLTRTDADFDNSQWPSRSGIENNNNITNDNGIRQESMSSIKYFLDQFDNSDGNIKSYLPSQLRTSEASNAGSIRNNSGRFIDTTKQMTRAPLRRSNQLRRSMSLTELDDIDVDAVFVSSMGENSTLRFLEISEGSLPPDQQQQLLQLQQQHQQPQQQQQQIVGQMTQQQRAEQTKAVQYSSSSGSSRGSILKSAGSSKSKSPNSKEGVGWAAAVHQSNPRIHFAGGKPPSQSSNMSIGSVRSSGSSWLDSFKGNSAGSSRSILSDISTDMVALDLADNSPFLRDSIQEHES